MRPTAPAATSRTGTSRTGDSRTGGRSGPGLLVPVLCVTQTAGYGVLYYAIAVVIEPMAADLNTGTAQTSVALAVSVLVAAAGAVPVGRWLDRRGGRAVMVTGSVLGVLAVVSWSRVQTVGQLYAVFVLIGLASSMSLYEAAFSVLVATADPARRDTAVLTVTIVAGFASSIFFPLTAALTTAYGWRTALVVLAALLAVTAVPGHLTALPDARTHHSRAGGGSSVRIIEVLWDKGFWLLGSAFVLHSSAVSAVGVLLVTFLRQAGHSATVAASLAGLLGVLSVTGRIATTAFARRHGIVLVTAGVFAIQAAAAAALPVLARSLVAAAACVAAFGLGFGVATIARPAIVAGRYGTARYATIAGILAAPVTAAKAVAPVVAALLPPGRFLTAAAAACFAAATLLLFSGRG